MKNIRALAIGVTMISATILAAGGAQTADQRRWPGTSVDKPTPKVPGMPEVLAKNLANFDDLDFHVYTGQQWENLHKSHAQNIVVHYPQVASAFFKLPSIQSAMGQAKRDAIVMDQVLRLLRFSRLLLLRR